MNIFTKIYSRAYQGVMYLASFVLPWRMPKIFVSEADFVEQIVSRSHTKVMLVTDGGITKIGLYNSLVDAMRTKGIEVVVYDETVPNPTIANIEKGLSIYMQLQCTALVAFGGGSSMDCAKGIGARVARQHKSVPDMRGVLKVCRRLPDLFAVPTTAC